MLKAFTFCAPDSRYDHAFSTSVSGVHGPGCTKSATAGRAVHRLLPSAWSVAVGTRTTGPTPQMSVPVSVGVIAGGRSVTVAGGASYLGVVRPGQVQRLVRRHRLRPRIGLRLIPDTRLRASTPNP